MEEISTERLFQIDNWKKIPVTGGMKENVRQSQLIARWPSRKDFADDLDVGVGRVHKWASDETPIPSVFFARVLKAAEAREIKLTAEELVHAVPMRGAA